MRADYSTRRSPGLLAQGAWLLLTVLAAGATAGLGLWQLDRAHQKEARAARLAEQGALPALPAQALARDAAAAAAQRQRRIVLEGRWLGAHTVYLANRTMDGHVGFDVLTPLRLPAGDAVVVQRGWVPRDPADPQRLPPLRTADEPVLVSGHLAGLPDPWVALGAEGDGPIRQNLDLAALERASAVTLRPLIVVEEANASNANDGLLRHWAAPTLNVERNYGYAVQWFAMSAAIVALYLWLRILRPARRATT